ncbi:hypothetical protein GEMRC1_008987 [Eukaryota sp. GEM-RC1]
MPLVTKGTSGFRRRSPSHPLVKYFFLMMFVGFCTGVGLLMYGATFNPSVRIDIGLFKSNTVLLDVDDNDVVSILDFEHFDSVALFSCPKDVALIENPYAPVTFSTGPIRTDADDFSSNRWALNTDSQVNVSVSSPASVLLFSHDSDFRTWREDRDASHALDSCIGDQCQPSFPFSVTESHHNYTFVFHNPSYVLLMFVS